MFQSLDHVQQEIKTPLVRKLVPTDPGAIARREAFLRAICEDACPHCKRAVAKHCGSTFEPADAFCSYLREDIYRQFVQFLTRGEPSW